MTRREIVKEIEERERKGEFDVHVDTPNLEVVQSSDAYPYIKKPLGMRIRYWLYRTIIVHPFSWYKNRFVLKTEIRGRENLKGIEAAVVTSNHVQMWDCLTLMRAMRGHRLYITVAYFNNMKGFLGEMMRACNIMPLNEHTAGMKRFVKAVNQLLKSKHYVMFYPEQAMWWSYEKPRPYKDGAYHFAAENQVPIISVFITFRQLEQEEEPGIHRRQFVVNIMPPIYPKPELSRKENVHYMKYRNYELCKEKYEEFYGRKLTYQTEDENKNPLMMKW